MKVSNILETNLATSLTSKYVSKDIEKIVSEQLS